MGTWGAGNFDSDTAADHLAALADRLVSEVTDAMAGDPVELEPDEYWGTAVPCNLELLLVLVRQGRVGVTLPSPEVIRAWQEIFLGVWERTIDGLEPDPAYKDERRVVLDETFERLAEASAVANGATSL
ncbi:DUF4259 domain-containing protein [Streptomyces lushanensis]|uniref:DUF4259 domain-containing protein n=1 Tax=Streptomyces lushanensis TaxID=1434255 RepID=UPI00082F3309|nr:DUF4259 domain-containing protein [Streptomyces lushanensis]